MRLLLKVVSTVLVVAGVVLAFSATAKDYMLNRLLVLEDKSTINFNGAEQVPSNLVDRPFRVFDGTKYKNKPDMSPYGISRVDVIYPGEIWRDFKKDHEVLPDRIRIRDVVAGLSRKEGIIIIDIEHWKLSGVDTESLNNNISKYKQVLTWFKDYAPKAQIGYFGRVPSSDYWRAIDGRRKGENKLWKADNSRVQALADAVDILFPSLYTFYLDRQGWVKNAEITIAEARRLSNGKPVYVFLWPQFHDSNRLLRCEYIPGDYWKLELETAMAYADGAVIWGGWDVCNPKGTALLWNENAEWWQVTLEFLRKVSHKGL